MTELPGEWRAVYLARHRGRVVVVGFPDLPGYGPGWKNRVTVGVQRGEEVGETDWSAPAPAVDARTGAPAGSPLLAWRPLTLQQRTPLLVTSEGDFVLMDGGELPAAAQQVDTAGATVKFRSMVLL